MARSVQYGYPLTLAELAAEDNAREDVKRQRRQARKVRLQTR